MTVANDLRHFVVAHLEAEIGAVGGRVYSSPTATAEYPYISLTLPYFTPEDADCIIARRQTVQVDVWSNSTAGPVECEAITDAVKEAMHSHTGDLGQHALAFMRVTVVRVMDDPQEGIHHGVVQVEALVEERG